MRTLNTSAANVYPGPPVLRPSPLDRVETARQPVFPSRSSKRMATTKAAKSKAAATKARFYVSTATAYAVLFV
ncbi:unnamed protein product, partial [Amoebophrya sp. A25]|eukprot:GSA25T00019291001.1